ncbi:DEAD/DEAH box helicase [Leifsonia sp. McL0607]|uniref:DEAD/DEAH box helicase n=1 Tax=Leifsonia sp. McL0607 TaxID=3415672 RepID=UPI003CE9915E
MAAEPTEAFAEMMDEATLRRTFGVLLAAWGTDLAVNGAVSLERVDEVDGAVVARAIVADNATVFACWVAIRLNEASFGAECECPDHQCAHVVAVLAVLAGLGPPRAAAPKWQQVLDRVVDGDRSDGEEALGLFFTVRRPEAGSYNGRSRRGVEQLSVRPAIRGTRGRWIKSGISWSGVSGGRDLHSDHDSLLTELMRLYDLSADYRYWSRPDWLPLDRMPSRSLWSLLAEMQECGVSFIGDTKGQHPVAVENDPAEVRFDLTVRRKRLRLQPQLVVQGEPVDEIPRLLIGSPPVGFARVTDAGTPEERIVLRAFVGPLASAVEQVVAQAKPITVPLEDLDRFQADYLPQLQRVARVGSSDQSYSPPQRTPLKAVLRVQHEGLGVDLRWSWPADRPRRQRSVSEEDAVRVAVLACLDESLHALMTGSGVHESTEDAPFPSRRLEAADAVRFTESLRSLRSCEPLEIEEVGDELALRPFASEPVIEFEVDDAAVDWFDLWGTMRIGDVEVPFADLFVHLARNDPFYIAPDGRWLDLCSEELDRLRALIAEAGALSDRTRGALRVGRYQVEYWSELVELGIVRAQESAWFDKLRGLSTQASIEPVAVPAGFLATLRPYQSMGLSWLDFLRRNGLGGVLADDMGLGKTVQVLAMIARAREEAPDAAPFLVVAPTSVIGNWVAEAHRFAPGLRVVGISATGKRRGTLLATEVTGADIVVTSYALLRYEAEDYSRVEWSGLLLDEAQQVKNRNSKTYRAIRDIGAPFTIAVTGTPLENNLGELWAIFSLCSPGLLGDPDHFRDVFRDPIEKAHDAGALDVLQRRIRPFLLRRTKEAVAPELPQKTEQVVEIELHPDHRRLYDRRLQRERQKILGLIEDDFTGNYVAILGALTTLRQHALDPTLVEDDADEVPSAKLEHLTELIGEAVEEGHNILVFSTFTAFLRKARDRAESAGIRSVYLDGATRGRQRAIDTFRSGGASVFFISLKAGGVGLNLTEADYCVLLDPWWNPAAEAQAVDRAHRIGQQRPVYVYRLIAKGTIEHKVLERSAEKRALFDALLSDGEKTTGSFSADDIRELLS